MSIELKIFAADPAELAQNVVHLGLLFAPQLRAAQPAAPQQASVAEQQGAQVEDLGNPAPQAAEPAKRGRPKKTPAIDLSKNEEAAKDVPGAAGAADGSGSEGDASAPAAAGIGAGVSGGSSDREAPKDEAPAKVDDVAVEPVGEDWLRQYTIREYLNACIADQNDRTEAFRGLLAQFELKKLKDLYEPEVQVARTHEFKALVDKKIAEAKKAAGK